MIKFLLRRIIISIPTIVIICLFGFWLSSIAPGDPAERLSSIDDTRTVNNKLSKKYWRIKLGLDLPIFYFAIRSIDECDTLHRIPDKRIRETLERLYEAHGNWYAVSSYFNRIGQCKAQIGALMHDTTLSTSEVKVLESIATNLAHLPYQVNDLYIQELLSQIQFSYASIGQRSNYSSVINDLKNSYENILLHNGIWKKYVPRIAFYPQNRFHRWIFGDGRWYDAHGAIESKGIIRGDFGLSYTTREPIQKVIGSRLFLSLTLAFLSVFLAYLISIPIGVLSARWYGGVFDRLSAAILFALFSLPSFWFATLLLMYFANPDQLQIFPASGIKPIGFNVDTVDTFQKITVTLPYLVLPLICYTYSSIAFLSRTLRASMLDVLDNDFIRTARAKGLNEFQIVFKHALKNSLLPLITVFANVFPYAIGGSVIIETIFSLPGIGAEAVRAIYDQNFPMIIAVFTLSGVMTVAGYLLSDILYVFVDPRIRYSKHK